MRDIEAAARAVVDNPASTPTPVDVIASAARRRRHRRVVVATALATVVVVLGAAGGFALSRRTDGKRVTVGPRDGATITDPQMRAHLGLDVPEGWVPVDYGDARLFVPPSWKVTAGGCGGPAPGWVEVGGPYKEICGVRAPTFIGIENLVSDRLGVPARTIHGYDVYATGPDPDTFVIPELHVTIRAEGPDRDAALATLAPSSRRIALTYKGAAPSDWNSVGYSGITVSYPPDWPQFPDGTSCPGVPPARVTLIDVTGIGCGSGGQPDTGPTRDGLRIGRAQPWLPSTEPKQTTISNGPTSMLLQPDPADRSLTVVVQLNETNGVPVEIGLGVDGRVAAAILASIRIDPSVSTTTTSAATSTTVVPADAVVPTITGDWKPVSITGYDGPLTSPPLSEAPLLSFDAEGNWGGSDGCNGIGNGRYTAGPDGHFAVSGDTAQTLVGCSQPEVPTLKTVNDTARFEVAGSTLTLFARDDHALATYERVPVDSTTDSTCGAPDKTSDSVAEPTSRRLDTPRDYVDDKFRLDPPAPTDTPTVMPSKVWSQTHMDISHSGSTFELLLARYSSSSHESKVLAWVLIGHNVPVLAAGSTNADRCGAQIIVFNAATGGVLSAYSMASG